MALINGLDTVVKGTESTVTLDKAALLALPTLMSNPAFSAGQIKKVRILFRNSSDAMSERKELVFDFTQASPTDTILCETNGVDTFTLTKIIVFDFDAGHIEVPANEIPALSINLAAGGGGSGGGATPQIFMPGVGVSPDGAFMNFSWMGVNLDNKWMALFPEGSTPGAYNAPYMLGAAILLTAGRPIDTIPNGNYFLAVYNDSMGGTYSGVSSTVFTLTNPVPNNGGGGGGGAVPTITMAMASPHSDGTSIVFSWMGTGLSGKYMALFNEGMTPGAWNAPRLLGAADMFTATAPALDGNYFLAVYDDPMGGIYSGASSTVFTVTHSSSGGGSGGGAPLFSISDDGQYADPIENFIHYGIYRQDGSPAADSELSGYSVVVVNVIVDQFGNTTENTIAQISAPIAADNVLVSPGALIPGGQVRLYLKDASGNTVSIFDSVTNFWQLSITPVIGQGSVNWTDVQYSITDFQGFPVAENRLSGFNLEIFKSLDLHLEPSDAPAAQTITSPQTQGQAPLTAIINEGEFLFANLTKAGGPQMVLNPASIGRQFNFTIAPNFLSGAGVSTSYTILDSNTGLLIDDSLLSGYSIKAGRSINSNYDFILWANDKSYVDESQIELLAPVITNVSSSSSITLSSNAVNGNVCFVVLLRPDNSIASSWYMTVQGSGGGAPSNGVLDPFPVVTQNPTFGYDITWSGSNLNGYYIGIIDSMATPGSVPPISLLGPANTMTAVAVFAQGVSGQTYKLALYTDPMGINYAGQTSLFQIP